MTVAERLFYEHQRMIPYVLRRTYPIRRMIRGYEDDLKQEGEIALWRACNSYRESEGAFSTFAFAAIQRSMIRYYDREIREARETDSMEEPVAEDENGGTLRIGETVADRENWQEVTALRDVVDKVVLEFPEEERSIIIAVLCGTSQNRLAKSGDPSQPTISRIIKKFRERVKEEIHEGQREGE